MSFKYSPSSWIIFSACFMLYYNLNRYIVQEDTPNLQVYEIKHPSWHSNQVRKTINFKHQFCDLKILMVACNAIIWITTFTRFICFYNKLSMKNMCIFSRMSFTFNYNVLLTIKIYGPLLQQLDNSINVDMRWSQIHTKKTLPWNGSSSFH